MYKDNVHGWKLGETITKMWICAVSNLVAVIPSFLICQLLATFSVFDFLRTVFTFRKRKRNSSSCFNVVHKMRNSNISRRNRSVTAVKCIVVVLVIFNEQQQNKNRFYQQNNSARASHFLGTWTFSLPFSTQLKCKMSLCRPTFYGRRAQTKRVFLSLSEHGHYN